MRFYFSTILFALFFICYSYIVFGQSDTTPAVSQNRTDSNAGNYAALTVVYNIQVNSDRSSPGIEETYNGGIQTIFVANKKARIRLVSLMRIQSIFFLPADKSGYPVSIVKESGKKRIKYHFTKDDWNVYNNKYENDSVQLTNDSLVILNYACRKAFIILNDGRKLTVYYTNQLKPISPLIEPAFSKIPGLVLQYQYDFKKGSMVYTAGKISQEPITADIFRVPSKGYIIKKYCAKCQAKPVKPSDELSIN